MLGYSVATVLARAPVQADTKSARYPIWYVTPLTWNVLRIALVVFPGVHYLFRREYDRTVSDPAVYFGKLGLVLKPESMVDGPAHGGFPSKALV